MSSRDATPSSSECFVARRSSSIACRLPGSATATLRTSPSSAYGMATERSSVCTGMSWDASTATPTAGRSTIGRWWRTASMRATPSEVATPSSISACVTGVPSTVRPRTSASASGATSAVCSSRSRRSSAVSSTPNGVASERPGATRRRPSCAASSALVARRVSWRLPRRGYRQRAGRP